MTNDAFGPEWRAENQRQTNELTEALQKVIDDHGERMKAEGRPPLMNACAGALAAVVGGMLASIEDAHYRKMLRRQFEKALPTAIANARIGGYAQIYSVEKRGAH